MLPIIQKRTYWYTISSVLVIASIAALVLWRLNFGIDFTGGSLLQVGFTQERPDASALIDSLRGFGLGDITAQYTSDGGTNLRFKEVDEPTHRKIVETLTTKFAGAEERRFETVGSIIGKELKTRSAFALILLLLLILFFIAWSFRKVSRPVSSWRYGLATIAALFHDVIITLGVFSVLGHFLHIEVGAPFIAAALTVLAYSVNDTIVVFDRTRENLFKIRGMGFADVVNTSVNQTMLRSFNTSLTILLSLFAIFFFGGESIKYFALALIIGIGIGTYSSIFLASPLLVSWSGPDKGR